MKKLLSLLCAAALLFSLAACEKQSGNSAYAGSSIAGEVTAIEDSAVTLLLGELTESENDGSTPPEMPSGQNDGNTPPEMPSGQNDGSTPPEMPGASQKFTAGG